MIVVNIATTETPANPHISVVGLCLRAGQSPQGRVRAYQAFASFKLKHGLSACASQLSYTDFDSWAVFCISFLALDHDGSECGFLRSWYEVCAEFNTTPGNCTEIAKGLNDLPGVPVG